MEDQSLGHRSRAGSHLKHHLCSCHTVQCSEPPFTTHRHKPGCQGSVSHQGQPTGPWLIPSCCHCTEPQRDQSWGTQQQQPLTLPCLRAGRAPQHPYPLNTPRRSEHNSSWILTFSTSSLQSCRGHRATGKEISVGDVAKHSALHQQARVLHGQQANSRDKPALHPAAAARSMPLPLIPAPSSSVSQWESKFMPPEPAARQLCSLPGLLQPLHSIGSRKKRINSRVLRTARLTLLKLQRLVLKDSLSFRIVERQVSFLSSGRTEASVPHPWSRELRLVG